MGHLDLVSMKLKAGWFFGLSPSPIVVTIDGLAGPLLLKEQSDI